MRYKLACFDLDGTLLDTLGGLTRSLNAARRMNNLPLQTEEQVKAFINNGVVKMMERSLAADNKTYNVALKEQLLKDYVAYYNSHCLEDAHPYNGISEVLCRLKADGMLLACVTNKDDEPAKRLIDRFFPNIFDYVKGSVEGVARKPSPEPIERCLEHFGIQNSEAVYVGDSETDIITALNSDMDSISCTWGYRPRKFLVENGALFICTEPIDLRNIMR